MFSTQSKEMPFGLITGTKWELLQLLAKKRQSPSELAKKLKTTIANVSSQLRLLQTAGLIKSEKARLGKGKPRTVYSLADQFAFIVLLADGIAKAERIKLTTDQLKVLKKWLKA